MSYELATSTHWRYDFTEQTPFLDNVERIINAGFKNLDFNFLDMINENCMFRKEGYLDWIYECKEFVESRGAKWVQAHAVAPETIGFNDICIDHIHRSIKSCSILGIPWIVMHHNFSPKQWGSSLSPMEFNLEFFSQFLDTAEKYGIGIAIENNTSWPFFENDKNGDATNHLIELVDKLGGDHIGICWDVGHSNVASVMEGAEHIAHQSEQLKIIGNRLKATHIHDNNTKKYAARFKIKEIGWQAFDEHIEPYLGDVDWDDVIKGLDSIKYSHYFTYETHKSVNAPYPNEIADEQMKLLYNLGKHIIGKSTLK